MLSYKFATVCLCAVVSAARTKRSDRVESTAPDFTTIVAKMKEVDYHPEEDLFTVFETDGDKIEEVATPKPGSCSLNNLKSMLLECPKRGKVCIALYKFNYPRSLDSSTLKAKSALMYLLDEQAMKAPLGGFIKAKRVTMAFTQFVWGGLKNALSSNSVSPAASLEIVGSSEVESLDGDAIWAKMKAGAGRIDAGEGDSFKKHVRDQNAKAAGVSPVPTNGGSKGGSTGGSRGGSRGGSKEVPITPVTGPQTPVAAPVDTKAIIKEVEAAVTKSVEDTARKIAREEVGMAIRKLGSDIGEKTKEVGKLWMDKAKGIA